MGYVRCCDAHPYMLLRPGIGGDASTAGITLQAVRDAIRSRMVAVGRRVSDAYQSLSTEIADHVDAVGETLTQECDVARDLTPEALNQVEMLREEVDVLDALRTQAPAAYVELVRAATAIWNAPPVGRRRLSVKEADTWLSRTA